MNLIPEFDPLSFSEAALRLRSHRQQVLASNLVNSDTPGYQARDIAFADVLREQLQGAAYQKTPRLAATDPRHFTNAAQSAGSPALLYRTPMQPSLDGNTVDLDTERAHFGENSFMTEATINFLSSSLRSRLTAITGQPS